VPRIVGPRPNEHHPICRRRGDPGFAVRRSASAPRSCTSFLHDIRLMGPWLACPKMSRAVRKPEPLLVRLVAVHRSVIISTRDGTSRPPDHPPPLPNKSGEGRTARRKPAPALQIVGAAGRRTEQASPLPKLELDFRREDFFEYAMLHLRLLRRRIQCRDEARSIKNKDRWISDQPSSLLHLVAVPSSFDERTGLTLLRPETPARICRHRRVGKDLE
jgi:hypothetical protein